MKNIVVLVSGGGTNLQALIDAQNRGEIAEGKITFKDPSHYAKGDTVNVIYLTAA